MTLKSLSEMFNRALLYAFEKKKFLFLFTVLAFAGVFVLFFRSLAFLTEGWWENSLLFFPLFVALGFLLAAEVVLVRLYARQIEGERPLLRQMLFSSWELMLRVSYFSLPLLLLYLLFWVLSGVFLLLRAIPYFGTFLSVILSFAPFLLNLGTVLLVLTALFLCFFVCPYLALESKFERKALFFRLKNDLFFNLLFFLIDLIPVWIVFKVLSFAASLTFGIESLEGGSLEKVLQSFFIMLPFLAILTPMIIFFFNFAVEVHRILASDKTALQEHTTYHS